MYDYFVYYKTKHGNTRVLQDNGTFGTLKWAFNNRKVRRFITMASAWTWIKNQNKREWYSQPMFKVAQMREPGVAY